MGIRGDLESKYWAEMGQEKPREMVNYFLEGLKDPNVWLRMQREVELTDAETSAFLHCIDWLAENIVTKPRSGGY